MNIPENILNTLTDEQKKKVEAAKSPEELLAIAKEYGHELTPEQLEAISGGSFWCLSECDPFQSIPYLHLNPSGILRQNRPAFTPSH